MTSFRWALCLLALGACTIITEDNAGAVADIGTATGGGGGGAGPLTDGDRYHPIGYSAAEVHGPPTNLMEEDCTECHGADLNGGTSKIGCDECHQDGWRDDCTYCHGGDDDTTGAPPRYIDGSSTPGVVPFDAHTTHGTKTNHPAYGCEQCHDMPTDVMTAGHLFVGDTTPARSEVRFDLGISPNNTYSDQGCANSYCHGNGRGDNGDMPNDAATPDCETCHAGPNSGALGWQGMSGKHNLHMTNGVACFECHTKTMTGATITNAANHVNGRIDIGFEGNFNGSATTCTGLCHLQLHFFDDW